MLVWKARVRARLPLALLLLLAACDDSKPATRPVPTPGPQVVVKQIVSVSGKETVSRGERVRFAVAGTGVVLVNDRQLVLGGERPPPRLLGKNGAIVGHRLIMGALHQPGWHGHRCPSGSSLALAGSGSTPDVSGHAANKGQQAKGEPTSTMASATVIKSMDLNTDGMISSSEHAQEATKHFGSMDTNHDGQLDEQEMRIGHDAGVDIMQ